MKQKLRQSAALILALLLMISCLPVSAVSAKKVIKKLPRYAVLILDGSGSMYGQPWETQQEAAINFCSSLLSSDNENYIAIVEISDESSKICDFTKDIHVLTESIKTVDDSGGTNITDALKIAQELLDDIDTSDTKTIKNILLCSDGMPEYGEATEDGPYTESDAEYIYAYANSVYNTASALKESGCSIYTLGFFHSLDEEDLEFGKRFMSDIQTSGYYEVNDPDDLVVTFAEVAEEIIDEPNPVEEPPAVSLPPTGTLLEFGGNTYEVTLEGAAVTFKKANSPDTTVIIPDLIEVDGITYRVTSIAPGAFRNNKRIKKVIIGRNIETIGSNAFRGCSNLSEIIIESKTLKEIGSNAFRGIQASAKISVPSSRLSAYRRLLKGKGQGRNTSIVKAVQAAAAITVSADKKIADRHGVFSNNAVSVKTASDYYSVTVKNASWLKVSAVQTDDVSLGLSKLPSCTGTKFYLTAAENDEEKRSAVVTVSDSTGKTKKNITVTQIGSETSYLEVETTTNSFQAQAAAGRAIYVLADEDTSWTAAASQKWIKIVESKSAAAKKYASKEINGTNVFYIYVKANGTYKTRSGYVTVSAPKLGKFKINVRQAANTRSKKALLQELKVGVSKKTFRRGRTSQVKFTYPKGLSAKDIRKISYSSSKKKVASVNNKGTIKAIRKGKAVISAKVTLTNGASKTFKLRITVGTRNVKLARQ